MHCASCSRSIPHESVVCPFCAAPVASSERATALEDAVTSLETGHGLAPSAPPADSPSRISGSDPGAHGRFLPGTVVAGRYRMVGLLGRGGMGEVYRADDLKLGQPVALKFLPADMVASDEDLRRLFDEVRTARKVSHPNVCRVFDVGEADGHHYVSMEYVDGEDLASLLRRIGRLPEDKAVEIARQLCAALAAAHQEGVLHRDLKPANIMLDGRGRVKLTDFGLAAVAEVRSGTPVYMAPEQLAGTEVSARSDIYSLGVVLYELFTGKRVFEAEDLDELSRLHESRTPTSLPDIERLDPAIDRLIRRCMEKDPASRPPSALVVAAGLPGADPLAAALAAGETPSPEMVAEAGGEGTLPGAVAGPLLVMSLACALAVGVLQSDRSLVAWVPFEMSPSRLEARAVEVLEELGHPTGHADSASSFEVDLSYLRWLRAGNATERRLAIVENGRSASIAFWWRASPEPFVPASDPESGLALSNSVTLSNPPRTVPGMVALQLDTAGRLVWLDVVPERLAEDSAPSGAAFTDWAALFATMGLDLAAFESAPPRLTPPHFADERVAWEGAFPEDPETPVRIEAAAYRGRPISLRCFTPARPLQAPPPSGEPASGFTIAATVTTILIMVLLITTVIFGGLYVARRNVRSGRGDSRGARRLGFAIASAIGVAWVFGEHRLTPSEINAFFEMLIFVGAIGGMTWALYLAVEPFMRRRAPEGLIGWTRVLDGQWRDSLVARDVLLGCAAGSVGLLLATVPKAMGPRIGGIENNALLPPASFPDLIGAILSALAASVMAGLALSFLYSLSFLALGRRRWLSFAVWLFALGSIGFIPGLTINGTRPAITLASSLFWTVGWALWLYVLFRLGLLAFVVMSSTFSLLSAWLPTLDFTAWYGGNTAAGLALFAALVLFATYHCVEWKGGLAEALSGDA